jgi:3-oxoacyl-[acyl-carrier protein] reductase
MGIGRAIAAELVAVGAMVAISSRSQERIDATAAEVGATGFAWDSADLDGAGRLLRDVEGRLGPIDVLVCNTGGPPAGPDPLGFSREDWEAAYRSLVLAPMALVERVVPGMRRRGWGRILNVVSTTVREPAPNLMLSNSHRAAMLAAFKTVSSEVAGDGVTLNSILPGRIETERLVQLYGSQEAAEAVGRAVPAGRLGTVEEMAGTAAFLVSERASYITGQWLAVDGGVMKSV